MVWGPGKGSAATIVQVAWKVIRKEPPAKVYRSTAVYSNRWGGFAVGGNCHGAPTGLKLWHSIEPVVDWPNTPPEAVISPVHGPVAWKTSAIVMVTSWGGVAAAGATNDIVVASDIAARSSSLRMIVLLSGAVRRLASVELYCPMTPIH
jgi:hypothetical protein